jgi:hypothetical protein
LCAPCVLRSQSTGSADDGTIRTRRHGTTSWARPPVPVCDGLDA